MFRVNSANPDISGKGPSASERVEKKSAERYNSASVVSVTTSVG